MNMSSVVTDCWGSVQNLVPVKSHVVDDIRRQTFDWCTLVMERDHIISGPSLELVIIVQKSTSGLSRNEVCDSVWKRTTDQLSGKTENPMARPDWLTHSQSSCYRVNLIDLIVLNCTVLFLAYLCMTKITIGIGIFFPCGSYKWL